MPVISPSSYRAPMMFSNPHVQTIFPSLLRRVAGVVYSRSRIDTPDGDFLDLDTSTVGSEKAVIVLHGLEGDSTRSYVLGMVKALNKNGWDAVAMNFRGCSGECNKTLRFYHSGDTGDLATVISHVSAQGKYSEIALVGFSLGGNVVLKYLGERGAGVPAIIRRAAAISVPCDLTSGSVKLAEPSNRLYMKRFLRMLRKKIRMKMAAMPGLISDDGYETVKSFKEFDDRYTAPAHGFQNAEDYWEKASSKPFFAAVSVPTLLINAADDPFLSKQCFPTDEAQASPLLFLEVPDHGGHVGFVTFNRSGEYWTESRVVSFLNGHG
ncbi:MAG: alpha/beta fold hydrolase [Desulfomonile tiedjei]|nr:alpha/beta fold hydrolase [Desulfomonile tiedjei]